MTSVHQARARLRAGLAAGEQLRGTFVKLPSADVIEVAAATGLDFVVVDLEHSTLGEHDAIGLVRHADGVGFPALVRLPSVDHGLVARLLENGAAGIQLSSLRSHEEARTLQNACHHAPRGERSVSLANRAAGFGRTALADYLEREQESPPVLVGQIESDVEGDLSKVLTGLDVAFVGVTDLAVHLGLPDREQLDRAVGEIRRAAERAGVNFGGWAASSADAAALDGAGYVVIGSDLQLLATALHELTAPHID
ncbi:HpcH/HpaI aldolase family protein [Nocardioides alcanivorans]|uniref:HpcH/HpaI aldolase family protein n=1 Tax=Nocardioides alcanivorans TaxID=2897352 RepID=UPI001F3B9BA5|nr:aldolase/citrate lyase family protein [Nocardioides alcanivorans]